MVDSVRSSRIGFRRLFQQAGSRLETYGLPCEEAVPICFAQAETSGESDLLNGIPSRLEDATRRVC